MNKQNKIKEPPKDVSEKPKKEDLSKETELKQKVDELTGLLKVVQADSENYKKRLDKDRQEFCSFANAELISKLLPILDSLELALINVMVDKNEKTEFIKGIELIYTQLYDALEKAGLKHIVVVGKKFDPHFHEVLLQQESDEGPGIIIEELQKGYMFNGKLLRTSKVKISKKN